MSKKVKVVHKQGCETVSKYICFGYKEEVRAPLCAGARGLYKGKSYLVHRNWKYVTCKHCLKKREN